MIKMVHRSSIPLHWRLYEPKYKLAGNRCLKCGESFFPPRNICPNCGRKGVLKKLVFSGRGTIYSYTVIRTPLDGFEQQAPYVIGVIKLKEGPKIVGQIVDTEIRDITIGKEVKSVFRKIYDDSPSGLIHYGLKWVVIE